MLGVRQLAILVNKMDLVGYEEKVFHGIVREYSDFLGQAGIEPTCFVPVTGRDGDNVVHRSATMQWYSGPTVLETLDGFEPERSPVDKPFRMPVQDVYKFTQQGDDRRIIAGTVDAGTVRVGDEVVFYPSGKKSRVASIEEFNAPARAEVAAGYATGLTLTEQIYVSRGEVATRSTERRPEVTTRLRVSLFWLGKEPLLRNKEYVLKLGAARVPMRVEEIIRVIDASTLDTTEQKGQVDRHDVAECVLKLNRTIAFDLAHEIAQTSRFVIVHDYEIRGGGIVREALTDKQAWVRDKVLLRNYKWEPSSILPERRAEKYSQRSRLILVTGDQEASRKVLAKGLESRLFEDGKVVYFLGIGSLLYGVDADLGRQESNRAEHLRRLSEVANIMLDAGVILIVTAAELTQDDLEIIATSVDRGRIDTIWVGGSATTDLSYDLWLSALEAETEGVERLKVLLQDKGTIFRP
jgi:bifunctional enzyme CysN/CysC